MTDQKDYSFLLSPGIKTRYIAGSFDTETRKPHYEIEIKVPYPDVIKQVEIIQYLTDSPENCQWGWHIHNKSSWPVFVVVKKDGVLLTING